MTNYTLDWDTLFASGNAPSNASLGTVDLTFSTSTASGGAPSAQSSTVSSAQFGSINDGHLRLEMTATTPGEGFVQTINFDETGFPNEGVRNVAFTLLDVDQNTWQDQVQIIAYDLDGNALDASTVTLTPSGAAASAVDDTAQGEADANVTQDTANVAVSIDAEISRIDIVYTAGPDVASGLAPQDIGIGPISFTSDVVYDDSDGAGDGIVTGNDEDNIIFGSNIAEGGIGGNGTSADSGESFDSITAGDGDDTVFGGIGNDTILGGEGDDNLRASDGQNSILGGQGDDIIQGSAQEDILRGGADDDTFIGGGGLDQFFGDGGNDQVRLTPVDATSFAFANGGGDTDTLLVNFSATAGDADLRGQQFINFEIFDFSARDNDAIVRFLDEDATQFETVFFDTIGNNTEIFEITIDSLSTLNLNPLNSSGASDGDFFRVVGTNDAETITGTFISDELNGNGGADSLDGAGGDDTLNGGAANDTVIGGRGDDVLDGGTGDDTLDGNDDDDTIIASAGSDVIDGGDDADTYDATEASLVFVDVQSQTEAAVDKLLPGDEFGTDTVSNVETFIGTDGPLDDVIVFSSNVKASDVSGLDDTTSGIFSPAGGGANVPFGDSEDYQISDILAGTSPDGILPAVGPTGDYDITGGDEDGQIGDVAFSEFENIAFTVGPDGIVDGLSASQLMELGFTDAEGDMITTGNDVIDGVSGVDTIRADAGDDTIVAGDNGTDIDGGADRDTYDASEMGQILFLNVTDDGDGGLRKITLAGQPSNDSISGVEDYIAPEVNGTVDTITLRTSVLDTETTTAISDLSDDAVGTFTDPGGTSTDFGPAESYQLSNILTGTAPSGEAVVGPVGEYNIIGGDETGQIGNISFANFEDITFTVEQSSVGIVDGLDTGQLMEVGFTDTDGDEITDTSDSIRGNDGDDTIIAGGGDDTVDGGEGNDLIEGGEGADSLDGGDDVDTLSYATSANQVVVNLSSGIGVFGDAEGDTFVNFENLIGSQLGDALLGDSGDNVIEGGGGGDFLLGLGGDDTLRGGDGDDFLAPEADNPTLAGTFDGGADDDSLELDGTLFSLRNSVITDIETLNFDASGIDVTVELTPDQLESFTDVVTEPGRSGVSHRIEIEMADDTTADFSGVTFTNFDQPGDGLFILGDDDNETIIGSSLDDVIASAGGEDSLEGREGDDVFGVFTGDYKIDGGADTDIYDAFFVDVLVVDVDDTGAGFSTKFFSFAQDASDSFTNVETFVAGEAVDESDAILLTSDVLSTDVSTAITGLDDNASGIFTNSDGIQTAFGPTEDYDLSNILEGTSPDTVLPEVGPVGDYRIIAGDEDGQIGNIAFENFEDITFTVVSAEDGIVDGLDDAELMELGYTDAQGDQITTGADSILGNDGADTIDGAGGEDTIEAREGDDVIVVDAVDVDDLVSIDGGADSDTLQVNFTDPSDDLAALTDDVTNVETLSIDAAFDDVTLRVDDVFLQNLTTVSFGTTTPVNEENISVGVTGGETLDLSDLIIENAEANDGFNIFGSVNNETIIAADTDDFINANLGDDMVTAGGGDDVIAMAGNDTVLANSGDDTIFAGTGTSDIDGGEDSDTYTVQRFGLDFQTDVIVEVDENGNGTVEKLSPEGDTTTDTVTSIESFVGAGASSSNDVLRYQTEVSASDIDTSVTGLDTANATGSFTPSGSTTAISFGPTETYTLSDIFAGTPPAGGEPAIGPAGDYQIESGVDTGTIGSISYEDFETLEFTVAEPPDGVVDGTDDAQVMELGFVDAQGDQITTGADSIEGNAGADTIDGDAGNDTIDGGGGQDSIDGGEDDDVIIASGGVDSIDGGEGTDTYDASSVPETFVNVDLSGDGTANKSQPFDISPGVTDEVESIERFVAGEGPSGFDTIVVNEPVRVSDIQGLSDDAQGTFSLPTGDISFGPSDDYALSDLLAGTSPDGSLPAVGPSGDYFISSGDEDGQIGDISFENFEGIAFTIAEPDGIVDGADDGETMDLGFTDLDGDAITIGADSIEGNDGEDTIASDAGNDTIDGGAGSDDIDAGADDDLIFVSSGSDTIDGGEGSDTLDASSVVVSTVTTDFFGDGTVGQRGRFDTRDTATDTVESIEQFVASEGPGQDEINFSEQATVADIQISDDASGRFFPDGGSTGIAFGSTLDYQLSDILSGMSPGSGLPAVGPVGDYEIDDGTESGQVGDVSFDNFEVITFSIGPDGVVDGLDTGQLMELGFTDAQGDQITTGADTILGNGGDDIIQAGPGDVVEGGAGDDIFTFDPAATGDDLISITGGETEEEDTIDPANNPGGRIGDALDLRGLDDVRIFYEDTNGNPVTGPTEQGVATFINNDGDRVPVEFSEIENILLGSNGIVDGTDDAQLMELGFTDADGDQITTDADSILGNDGADTIDGAGGADTIDGGEGDDSLLGSGGADSILGSEGDDTILPGPGADIVDAGEDDDVVRLIRTDGFTQDATLDGGAGEDTLEGVFDSTSSFSTSFILTGSVVQNFETLSFGSINSEAQFELTENQISQFTTVEFDGTDAEAQVEIDLDTLTFFDLSAITVIDNGDGDGFRVSGDNDSEEIIGSATDDILLGSGGENTLRGGGGDDLLANGSGGSFAFGEEGMDTFSSSNGTDTLDGGSELDSYVIGGVTRSIDVTVDSSGDGIVDKVFINGFVFTDQVTSIERYFGQTGFFDDTITITDPVDASDVSGFDDTSEGTFTPVGGTAVSFGPGTGNVLSDFLSSTSPAGTYVIEGTNQSGQIGDVVFQRMEQVTFSVGGDGVVDGLPISELMDVGYVDTDGDQITDEADRILANDGNDTVIAGGGDDVVFGNAGDDIISGGEGGDNLRGGADRDIFRETDRSNFFGDRINGGDGGNDFDRIDLRGLGDFRIINETDDADGNSTSGTIEFLGPLGGVEGTLNFFEIEKIICFTPGTRIITQKGYVPIEALHAGDKVMTRDNGFQEIAWIGERALTTQDLATAPKLQPILIRRGALGPDLPDRDMMVSPNHRMLQTGGQVELHFGETEVLTAAKHLTHHAGIDAVTVSETTYIHMLFEDHQIVMADGCWTESFFPGDEAMDAVSAAQREEIFHLFPELKTIAGRRSLDIARPTLKRFEAALI